MQVIADAAIIRATHAFRVSRNLSDRVSFQFISNDGWGREIIRR